MTRLRQLFDGGTLVREVLRATLRAVYTALAGCDARGQPAYAVLPIRVDRRA